MVNQAFSVAQPKLQTAALKYELNPDYNREAATLLAGAGAKRTIEIGTVLGQRTRGTIAAAVTDVGGGKGALTMANPATGAAVKLGAYKVVIVEPAADAGAFVVEDPDGIIVGHGTVGVAFDGAIKFTLADGGTDFAAGDTAVVTISESAAADSKVVALDPAATNGSQTAWGVSIVKAVAADGVDGSLIAVVRGPAIFASAGLVWPAGISAGDKAAAIAALAAKGIIIRGS